MNITTKNIMLLCSTLLLLPGCGRIIDWGKASFVQVSPLETDREKAQEYIRSIVAYDQLTTRAKFDALWLSDQVRTAYAHILALKCGKTEEQKKTFLRRQLEENNHFIAFYVLSAYEKSLGDSNSEWAVFLRIGDKNYSPIEVKSIELSPEYIFVFDKKYTRFKVPYSIKFDAKDIDDNPLITDQTRQISLYFRSVENEVVLTWDMHHPTQKVSFYDAREKEESVFPTANEASKI